MKLSKFFEIVGIIHTVDKKYEIPRFVLQNVSQKKEYLDAIIEISDASLSKFYSGERDFTYKIKQMICDYFDKKQFSIIFQNVNEDIVDSIIKKIKKYAVIESENFPSEMAQLFIDIVIDSMVGNNDENIRYSRHFGKLQKELFSNAILKLKGIKRPKSKLKTIAARVESKISKDNKELLKRVKKNAVLYYPTINGEMKRFEKENKTSSDEIRKTIRYQYSMFAKRTENQEEIFDSMVMWLKKETNSSIDIAGKIISYFIHTCEVFDVIAK